MNPNLDWQEELYQLLIGYISEAPFDEGVREMADIAAYSPASHDKFLGAIQSGYDAALCGDPEVVDVINRGNARHVPDVPSAVTFMTELRDAYLSHYQKELARKAARR